MLISSCSKLDEGEKIYKEASALYDLFKKDMRTFDSMKESERNSAGIKIMVKHSSTYQKIQRHFSKYKEILSNGPRIQDFEAMLADNMLKYVYLGEKSYEEASAHYSVFKEDMRTFELMEGFEKGFAGGKIIAKHSSTYQNIERYFGEYKKVLPNGPRIQGFEAMLADKKLKDAEKVGELLLELKQKYRQ
jgi:hypothetical protein